MKYHLTTNFNGFITLDEAEIKTKLIKINDVNVDTEVCERYNDELQKKIESIANSINQAQENLWKEIHTFDWFFSLGLDHTKQKIFLYVFPRKGKFDKSIWKKKLKNGKWQGYNLTIKLV